MPFSKRSMCSGSTIPDCTTCKSCSTFGSALARQPARKSACFWLSPSRQMRSPGRITASSSAVVSLDVTIFPTANLLPAVRRSWRVRCYDHGGSDRKQLWICDTQLLEFNPALPRFAQKVLEHLDRELLSRTATIAETEWCKTCIVAYWQRFPVDDGVNGTKPAVMDGGIAAIADLKGRSIERAPGKAHLLAFSFIDLVTVRDVFEAIRIELFRILPMARIQARARMRADNITKALVRWARPCCLQGRYATAVRRNGAEQFHYKAFKRRECAARSVVVTTTFHGLFEP